MFEKEFWKSFLMKHQTVCGFAWIFSTHPRERKINILKRVPGLRLFFWVFGLHLRLKLFLIAERVPENANNILLKKSESNFSNEERKNFLNLI